MQETAYIIKQDGMPLVNTIHWIILSGGFEIIRAKQIKFPVRAFAALYPREEHPKVPEEAWRFNAVFNTTGICEIGILRAPEATRRLVQLAGRHSDPAECEVGSIRREFGASHANSIRGYPIHLKVIHRSDSAREAERDLSVIRSLFGA